MERIQQAIEKAKKERQGSIGGSGSDEPSLNAVSAEELSEGTASQASGSGQFGGAMGSSIRVSYSDTRVVELDEKTMKEKRIVAGFAHDARSEPYRQLRGQILKKFRAQGWQTLAITSPTGEAGSTLTAVNLAISLSMETNQTVMLVDLNLKQPNVAQCFGVTEVELGIVDHVKGGVPLEKILINPGYERLVIVPGVPQKGFTSEVLSSPEMNRVVQEIIQRYPSRIILFDLPSVLDHDDALIFAPKCDSTLMVLEEGGSKKEDVERAYQLLDGCNIVGSVLNKARYL